MNSDPQAMWFWHGSFWVVLVTTDIGTRSGRGACALNIGQAEVVLQSVVGACEIRPESNIRALLVAGGKGLDDLRGRVTRNDIAADKVVARSVKELYPIGIPAYIVFLDLVPVAGALEPD